MTLYRPKPKQNHRTKRILVFMISLWASSCSFVEIAYNNLDWYVVWQVNKFIDLDAAQEQFVSRATVDYVSWHRSEELPRYRDILIRMRAMAADSLTADESDTILTILRERILVLMDSASDETAGLLLTLSPAQIDVMESRMEKMNRKYETEDGYGEESLRKKRAERVRNRVEDWIGGLTEEQEQWLMPYAMRIPSTTAHWVTHRRWRQKRLLGILRSNGDPEEKKLAIHLWVTRPEDGRSEDYIKADRAAQKATAQFIVEMDRRLTPDQRKHLQENLTKYIRITEDLARK